MSEHTANAGHTDRLNGYVDLDLYATDEDYTAAWDSADRYADDDRAYFLPWIDGEVEHA